MSATLLRPKLHLRHDHVMCKLDDMPGRISLVVMATNPVFIRFKRLKKNSPFMNRNLTDIPCFVENELNYICQVCFSPTSKTYDICIYQSLKLRVLFSYLIELL